MSARTSSMTSEAQCETRRPAAMRGANSNEEAPGELKVSIPRTAALAVYFHRELQRDEAKRTVFHDASRRDLRRLDRVRTYPRRRHCPSVGSSNQAS
jgi:hypothetical protein